ncbi:MAG: response regulator transcription factor [Acutalibacteraceae bacterium]|nr:response regulator transcription factor [Oscillospiraceae bacterium]
MRILVVEDEKDLNKIISNKLRSDGYSVDSCFDGEEAGDYIRAAEYDGVILDIMMPKKDGLTLLKELREKGNNVPVLLLTAKDAVSDRVKGLDSGANDYLVKPFSFEELSARIRAMLRKNSGAGSNVFTVADLSVDTASKKVTRAGKEISLSAKEYALLEYMIRNKGAVLSREKIENHVWNFDYEGGTNVIDVYISYLRRKIDSGFEKKLIHTVRGSGYVIREEK